MPEQTGYTFTLDAAILFLGIYFSKMKTHVHTRTYKYVQNRFTETGNILGTHHSKRVKKLCVVYSNNGTSLSNKK